MIPTQIAESVLALPENERLELARRIVESLTAEHRLSEVIEEGAKRIDDIVAGKVRGLSEEDYRRAVG